MRMMRVLALLVVVGSIPVAAGADPIAVGDVVRFSDLPGNSGGGEFKLTDTANPLEWIITFCLQKTEYMNFTNNFIVGSITDHTLTDPNDKGGVGGQDPLSSQTAWLYTQFYNGSLANYVYGSTGNAVFGSREESANALQHAFWGFEDEEALDANNFFVQLALNNTPADFGLGRVAVLNMYLYDPTKPGGIGVEAQDQITMQVPEPSTLALLGAGLLGVCIRRRRQQNEA